jgi:hypothetical protein
MGSSLGLVDTDVLRGSSFIVNGRSVAQGRVQTLVVVVPEIASKLGADFSFGQEAVTMHETGLEGMKERFHVSVVAWSAAAGHALTNTQGSEAIPKGGAGILTASVTVKDQARGGAATTHGRVEDRPRQAGIARRAQAPSQDTPGVLIHHHCQVPPSTGHRKIGDIADPNLVHSGGSRSPEVIGMLGEEAMQARIGPVESGRARAQSALPHEPLHPPSAQAIPLSL